MRGIRIAALGAALVAGLGSTLQAQTPAAPQASAQGGGPGGHMRGHGMGGRLFRGISLSADQKARIRAIDEKYRPQMTALHQKMRAARQDGAQRPDSALRTEAHTLMEQRQAEVRGVLTADQQQLFDRNVADMRAHGKTMDGKGHRPGGRGDKPAPTS